ASASTVPTVEPGATLSGRPATVTVSVATCCVLPSTSSTTAITTATTAASPTNALRHPNISRLTFAGHQAILAGRLTERGPSRECHPRGGVAYSQPCLTGTRTAPGGALDLEAVASPAP